MIEQAGFVKLYRALVHWEWYTEVNTCKLFFHCLIKANYSTKKWQGITVRKNEFITSIEKLAVETGLTPSKVRTSLKKLESTNDLKIVSKTKYTKVVITSKLIYPSGYEKSLIDDNNGRNDKQDDKQNDNQDSNPLTNESQSNHNQLATTKKEQEEDIIKRKIIFREKVFSHSNFSNKSLNDFYNYWSEIDVSKNLMRFESQNFWELDKRLKKWVSNEKSTSLTSNFIKNR